MQDNLNKLDILFRQKDAEAEYDVTHITDHWSQMETVLNAKPWSFHFNYFKGTGFLKTIVILGILGYVGYIVFRNNHNSATARTMKIKQSMFDEPQPVTVESDTVAKINSAEPFNAEQFKRTKRLKKTKRPETIRATNNKTAIPTKESVSYDKKSPGIEYKKKYIRADSVKTTMPIRKNPIKASNRAGSPIKRSKKSKMTGQADHLKENRSKSTRQYSVSSYDTLKPTISIPVLEFRPVVVKAVDSEASIYLRKIKINVTPMRDTTIRW